MKERDESLAKCCAVLGEAAYKKNITLHRAINKIPYEVVFGILPWKEIPGRTEEESEQHTTQEKQNSPNLLPSELKYPSSQDDLLAPFESENTGQPSVADLQVDPSIENPYKHKYAIHECVRENQESYNKKMESWNKVEDFKIYEFVSIKIDKVDKTSPLHPNVLLGRVTEVDKNYAKIVTI